MRLACALATLTLAAWPAVAAHTGALAIADGARHCAAAPGTQSMWDVLQDGDTCRVVAFGPVLNAAPPVYYQLQVYLAAGETPALRDTDGGLSVGGPGSDGAGIALLVPEPDGQTLKLLKGWSGENALVETPRIVRTRQGPILLAPMAATVRAVPNNDAVFRAIGGAWQLVDDDWSHRIVVPARLEQRHGNAMDWSILRAYGALWNRTDAECCPSGGSYIAQLRLDGTHLRLAAVRYSRHALQFQ